MYVVLVTYMSHVQLTSSRASQQCAYPSQIISSCTHTVMLGCHGSLHVIVTFSSQPKHKRGVSNWEFYTWLWRLNTVWENSQAGLTLWYKWLLYDIFFVSSHLVPLQDKIISCSHLYCVYTTAATSMYIVFLGPKFGQVANQVNGNPNSFFYFII